LVAGRAVFTEQGWNGSLEEVARRAGVGVGTLYRHFPDRAALVRAVVLDLVGQMSAEGRLAAQQEATAFDALARFLRACLESRVSALVPAVLDELRDDEEFTAAQASSGALMRDLVEGARAAGQLRPDVGEADVGLLLVRLSRPLPHVAVDVDLELARRQLEVFLAGLQRPAQGLTGRRRDFSEVGTDDQVVTPDDTARRRQPRRAPTPDR
jgi:AcrR family transcriptional regulator